MSDLPVVTVYTTGPACFKCNATKNRLEKYGIPYEEVRVDQDREKAVWLRSLGFNQSPVVQIGDEDAWDGFSSTDIEEWARVLGTTAA